MKDTTIKWLADVPVPEAKPELQLSGEDGNVFFIMGRASKSARRDRWTKAQRNAVIELMTAGDYDHALRVCLKYFETS
jgi:hypothetical protein